MLFTVMEGGRESVGTPVLQLKLPNSLEFARGGPPSYKTRVPLVIRVAQEQYRWPVFSSLFSDA